ncbi:MAG: hypothetical protein HYX82_06375 [Chloroflexi bacterium]|nr:hypothetical protein [Chloroflexota bacterium]
MAVPFFDKQIKVSLKGKLREPASFKLGEQEFTVAEVLEMWHDFGFGKSPLRKPRWWQRRHRTYYRIRTTDGEVYEIYRERGTNLEHPERKKWFLSKKL